MVKSGPVKTILLGTVKRGRRQEDKKQTEEEVGRQHQGMDGPGVRHVPEGSGEQRKKEQTGCEIICGAPTTLAVRGQVRRGDIYFHVRLLHHSACAH